jgi:hypothetical protein
MHKARQLASYPSMHIMQSLDAVFIAGARFALTVLDINLHSAAAHCV